MMQIETQREGIYRLRLAQTDKSKALKFHAQLYICVCALWIYILSLE